MSRPRVILVEDDEPLLEVFASALREEYAVWVARDGTQALEVANELGWDADVLVVDLALGEGPRGDQFVSYYRTRASRHTPVIVVSGADAAYDLARSVRAAALLPKPVELDELLRTVRLFAGAGPDSGADAAD
jgi:DNA-binding response OmpR family regulator